MMDCMGKPTELGEKPAAVQLRPAANLIRIHVGLNQRLLGEKPNSNTPKSGK